MDTVRSIARVLFFLVTIAALVIVALIGAEFIMGQLRPPPAPVAEAGQETERQINLASPEELVLGIYLKLRAADLQKPASNDPTPIEFTVLPGESATEVAQRLAEEGLITDAELFRRYMRFYGLDVGLEAGDYQLAKNMTMEQIAKALQHARINEVVVRVIEGWRAEQIAEMLEKDGLTTSAAFMNAVRTMQLPYASLADRPAGASLEG
ncbi:MAG: endolytic transglycosylase MltG, partial [Anaerolineae bacterium]